MDKLLDRFNLNSFQQEKTEVKKLFDIKDVNINNSNEIKDIINKIEKQGKLIYYFGKTLDKESKNIVKKQIKSFNIFNKETNEVYYIKIKDLNKLLEVFNQVFENNNI